MGKHFPRPQNFLGIPYIAYFHCVDTHQIYHGILTDVVDGNPVICCDGDRIAFTEGDVAPDTPAGRKYLYRKVLRKESARHYYFVEKLHRTFLNYIVRS
jgi:hypothetical protein